MMMPRGDEVANCFLGARHWPARAPALSVLLHRRGGARRILIYLGCALTSGLRSIWPAAFGDARFLRRDGRRALFSSPAISQSARDRARELSSRKAEERKSRLQLIALACARRRNICWAWAGLQDNAGVTSVVFEGTCISMFTEVFTNLHVNFFGRRYFSVRYNYILFLSNCN